MRSFTSSRPVWSASSTAARRPGRAGRRTRTPHGSSSDGVEPRADPAVLGVLLAGALEAVDLALDGGAHVVGQRRARRSWRGSLGERPRRRRRRPAPCGWRPSAGAAGTRAGCFSMPSVTSVRIVRPARPRPAPPWPSATTWLEARVDVDGLEQLDLALERSGRATSRPCRPARRASRRRAASPVMRRPPSCSSSSPAAARYSRASSSVRLGGSALVDRLGLDPQGAAGAEHAGADAGPALGPHDERPACRWAARPRSSIRAMVPTRGVAVADPGDEQQAVVVARRRRRRPWPRRSRARW